MNESALFKLSYGLYIISSKEDEKLVGCVANTLHQVTSSPIKVSITLNKDNVTQQVIERTKRFNAVVLSEQVSMDVIKTFGFQSSKDIDKYATHAYALDSQGLPYLSENTSAFVSCNVIDSLDLDTHVLYVGEVIEAETLSDEPVMTYAYYHQVKNGATPKNAPSYQAKQQKIGWRCTVCGYLYEGDPLPSDYICPLCGADASAFEKV